MGYQPAQLSAQAQVLHGKDVICLPRYQALETLLVQPELHSFSSLAIRADSLCLRHRRPAYSETTFHTDACYESRS